MTNSIADILHSKNFDKPSEVEQIQRFVRDNFAADCTVDTRNRAFIITVKGSSLAGALRLRLYELQEQLQTDKKLVIRIGY